METTALYYTAIPILLGDGATAGRLAATLYRRHGKTAHWFGTGLHPLSLIYAKQHPIPFPIHSTHDRILVTQLCDFAKEQQHSGGMLCLIPCGDPAKDFLERNEACLGEYFRILPAPPVGTDPLPSLLQAP